MPADEEKHARQIKRTSAAGEQAKPNNRRFTPNDDEEAKPSNRRFTLNENEEA